MIEGYKQARVVTLPLWKWTTDEPKYIKFLSEMFEGKAVQKNENMAPATLANVINMETGEECQIICGTVLQSILNEEYPNQQYVEKMFMITQVQLDGKRYKNYTVIELEQA